MAIEVLAAAPPGATVVIAGGGLAGLEVARHLAILGAADVLVVEAGPDADRRHACAVPGPVSPVTTWLDPTLDPYFWRPWRSDRPPHYDGVSGLRRRLGGRSLYWHGVTLPIEPWALREPWWPAEVVRDLTGSWCGGPGLYDLTTADLGAWAGGSALSVAGPARVDLGAHSFVATPRAIRPVGDQGWEAYSPLSVLPATPGTVRILVDAVVERVLVRRGVVTGVRARLGDGGAADIGCAAVVLAAGTIESARLAGVGRGARRNVRRPVADHLVDKVTQGFTVAVPRDRFPEALLPYGVTASAYVLRGPSGLRTNVLLNMDETAHGRIVVNVGAMGEQFPSPRGAVRVPAGPAAVSPAAVSPAAVSPALTSPDRQLVREQRELLSGVWRGLAEQLGRPAPPLRFPDFAAAERTLETVLPAMHGSGVDLGAVTWSRALGTEYHEAGTLAFGRRIGPDHALLGTTGAYVAGPASFPRSGAANPSLTTLALARRLATVLHGRISSAGRGR